MMKKIIVLLLCLMGGSSLFAQENTILGTGALSQAGTLKYAIQKIQVSNPGGYSRPTIDMGNHTVQWDYQYMEVNNNGVECYGNFSTTTDLGSFVPSIIGGYGTGATLQMYFYDFDGTNYYYEVYSNSQGSGYVPEVTLSSSTGTNYQIYTYIEENGELYINYYDNNKTNLYTVAPMVSISFGGATATAILEGTAANGQNTAIGYRALYSNSSGKENTALGHESLYNSTGISNIGVGYLAGKTLTTGSNNIFIGNNAGKGIATGSGNLIIGNGKSISPNSNLNNSVIISDGNGTPKVFVGSSGTVKIGYGSNFTDENGSRLMVNGPIVSTSSLNAVHQYLSGQLSFKSPTSTYYHDFMFHMQDPNTFRLRAVVDANSYPDIFSANKLTQIVTFGSRVKGAPATESNDYVTLAQLSSGQTIGANIAGNALSASFLANTDISGQDLTSISIVPAGQLRAMNGSGIVGGPDNNWWNILSLRHSNPNNDNRMEIAGAFNEPNSIMFRNTGGSSTRNWNTFFHSGNIDYVKSTLGLPLAGDFDLQGITDRGAVTTNPLIVRTDASNIVHQKQNGSSVLFSGLESAAFGGASSDGIAYVYGENAYHVATNSSKRLTVLGNGNVGVGTTSPQEKLSVNGKIRAKEIKVEPINNWPDYVFEESYKPLKLAEVAAFVKKYKHLPEVPSAKEVAAHGLELGEMNKVLLKKIEELTIYLIDKDKQMELLAQRIANLEQAKK